MQLSSIQYCTVLYQYSSIQYYPCIHLLLPVDNLFGKLLVVDFAVGQSKGCSSEDWLLQGQNS